MIRRALSSHDAYAFIDAQRDGVVFLGHSKEVGMDNHEVPNEREPVTPEASAPKRARRAATSNSNKATPTMAVSVPPRERARRIPAKRTLASWCMQLERNGFSGIEAKRLVFEKTHPRDEGLTRG